MDGSFQLVSSFPLVRWCQWWNYVEFVQRSEMIASKVVEKKAAELFRK